MSSAKLCPTCHAPVTGYPENMYVPFCGRSCKLADLDDWLDGRHVIKDAPGSARDEVLGTEAGGTMHGEGVGNEDMAGLDPESVARLATRLRHN